MGRRCRRTERVSGGMLRGGDWTDGNADRFLIRLYGTDQSFRQSFSSINSTRTSEKLTCVSC